MNNFFENPNLRTVLISPHSDDIAYSLGGSMILNFFEKSAIMITVFTESNFSPRLKLSGSKTISRIRHLEDVAFAREVGLELIKLDFPEPPMRGMRQNSDIFGKVAKSDPLFEPVHKKLSDIINSIPNVGLIVSPLGISDHIDHLIVMESCLAICKKNNIRLAFYEDVPYAASLKLEQIRTSAESISFNNYKIRSHKINISNIFDNKLNNLRLYRTQIGKIIPLGVRLHSARLGVRNERIIEYLWDSLIFRYLFYYISFIRNDFFERIWYLE